MKDIMNYNDKHNKGEKMITQFVLLYKEAGLETPEISAFYPQISTHKKYSLT